MSYSSSSPAEERLERLETIVANMSSKFDQLLQDRHTNTESGSYNRNEGPRINWTGSGSKGSTDPKVAKLDFPRYCGDEEARDQPTLKWLSWISHDTVETKIRLVGFAESSNSLNFMIRMKRESYLWQPTI